MLKWGFSLSWFLFYILLSIVEEGDEFVIYPWVFIVQVF